MSLKEDVLKLKKEKNAIILAHYYVDGAVQDVADFVGDSYALAKRLRKHLQILLCLRVLNLWVKVPKC